MPEKKRVLIVDDEPDIRYGVSRWLDSAGYEAILASDGEQGIASAVENEPQVILLDLMMPGKDGMATLAELQMNSQTADIPVVILSASLRDEQRALDAGARCFVHKPYDGRALVDLVKAVVDQITCSRFSREECERSSRGTRHE